MVAFIIIASLLVVCFAVTVVFGVSYSYKTAYRPRPRGEHDHFRGTEPGGKVPNPELCREHISRLLNAQSECVYIRSHDGLKLAGYYMPGRGMDAPLALCFHGHRSSWQRDFSGIAPILFDRGFNVLFVDQRSHGESEGNLISLGVNEQRDVISWIEYALGRFGNDTRILLVGVSMGGASVLGSAGLGLPDNVIGIISDSAFSSAPDITVEVGCKAGKMTHIVSLVTKLSARVHGFRLKDGSAKNAVRNTDLPILILHSREDALVPYYMAEEIFASAKNATLVAFDKGPHVCEWLLDYDRYKSAFEKFFMELNI